MFQYEKLESEKYFDYSLERKEKRQEWLRSTVDTVWAMTAVMALTLIAGTLFLHYSSISIADIIYAAVSYPQY